MSFKYIHQLIVFFSVSLIVASCSSTFDGKNGVKTVYFPGSVIVEQTIHYKDGKRNGEFNEFYRNGQLKIKQSFINDTLTDSSFQFYENGKLKQLQYLKKGNREGTWKKFNEQGGVIEEINYSGNQLNGYSTKYTYRSLRPIQRWYYVNGIKEGKQEFFHQNGKPMAIVYFNKNHPCMGTEEWNEAGKKIDNDFDIRIKEENKLLLTGKLSFHITFSNPQPDDQLAVVSQKDSTNCLTTLYKVLKENDEFLIEYTVPRGGFVMETVKLAGIRKTAMGNSFIKTKTMNVAANNY